MKIKNIYQKKLTDLIKSIFGNYSSFLFSLLIGISFSVSIYLGLLQRHFFSYRYLAYAILIAIIGTFIARFVNYYVISPSLRTMSKGIKAFTSISTLFLSFILLLNITIQPIYYALPDTRMEIDFTIDPLSDDAEGVRLLWIETGQGYVPYTYMDYSGEWERVFGNTIFPPDQNVKLTWEGKVGSYAEIAFRKTSFDQPVSISWNGNTTSYNLNDVEEIDLIIENHFDVPWVYYLPFTIAFLISTSYTIFTIMLVLGQWNLSEVIHREKKRYQWLLYTIPMLITWSFFLLVFWPGFLTNDSATMYGGAYFREFSTSHSLFYQLYMALLIAIIPSPAFILIIQIVLFSVIISWGLFLLEQNGVPRIIVWTISLIMAIFPPNLFFSVTLWKDIPYAFSLLLLSIIVASIVFSGGKWVTKNLNWIVLAIVGFLVGVLRNNGWPSALSILLLLPLFFRKFWKYFTGSLLIGVFSYLLIQGVLFEQIIEKDDYLDQSNAVYLHHFGAHIDAGTNLTNDEKKYLYAILPKSEWRYDECNVGELWKSSSLDRGLFLANTKKNRDISLSLLIRNPAVDISHMLRAGGPAYKFIGNRCRMKSLHGFWAWGLGNAHWVVPNDFNVQENSLLPGMIRPIMEIFKGIGYFDDELEVNFHHPAFWLFVAFFSFSVLAIRKENIRFLLPIVPALSQSVVLFLIGFTPVFRYYYSNCLVGILFLGCLFIPKEVNST